MRAFAALVAVLALAACGGSGGSPVPDTPDPEDCEMCLTWEDDFQGNAALSREEALATIEKMCDDWLASNEADGEFIHVGDQYVCEMEWPP